MSICDEMRGHLLVLNKTYNPTDTRYTFLIINKQCLEHSGFPQTLRTSLPFVWAAGDVAEFPLPLVGGQRVSIGHWQMALKMGQVAGKNIAAEAKNKSHRETFDSVPVFWSMQYGKSLRYAGF
jgi:hypothetical protein